MCRTLYIDLEFFTKCLTSLDYIISVVGLFFPFPIILYVDYFFRVKPFNYRTSFSVSIVSLFDYDLGSDDTESGRVILCVREHLQIDLSRVFEL